MKISRDDDGFRFIGDCAPETGFVAQDVHCLRCSRRIDPLSEGRDIALRCSGCDFTGKVFWSETDLHAYLAEQWNRLRQACAHPVVNALKPG
ncbi:MAG TPA: hypothetical protein VFR84_16775 [Candidatus Angelobacter sp.]|nr:hypothetical protein [Candidatus Angelobacter sp.]